MRHGWIVSAFAVVVLATAIATAQPVPSSTQPPTFLPDLSGLAWVEGDRLLAVHDAKNDPKAPRASLLWLPGAHSRFQWQSLNIRWPRWTGPSQDLESLSRFPGTQDYLLAESGSAQGDRLFLARLEGQTLSILAATHWPNKVQNVEGTAIAQVDNQAWFVYAERAGGQDRVQIYWAPLRRHPLQIGALQSVTWKSPLPSQPALRLISALDIDPAGNLYAASASDPDRNQGPFRSWIWRLGKLERTPAGAVTLVLDPMPQPLAVVDGFKVESLALRPTASGSLEILLGTDDEDYGGVVRSLSLADLVKPAEP